MKYHSKRERDHVHEIFFLMKTIEIKNIIMFKKEKKKTPSLDGYSSRA